MKYIEINTRPFEIHMLVLDSIRSNSVVLELGCATGYFSKELKKKGCLITGIDIEREAVKKAKEWCDDALVGDLENSQDIPLGKKKFDQILLMDVIEHIIHRKELLQSVNEWLKLDGELILTTPNIAHLSMRWKLLKGEFEYTKVGIMDETHVHFYTKETLLQELTAQGFKIKKIVGSADFGQIPFLGRFLRHIPKKIQYDITQQMPTLLGVQWFVVATL